MRNRLVVLGSCGAWPEPGRACSGYLLEHAGARIVLDLGYGTLPRLLTELGSTAGDGIDAVVVTHAHPDHMVDLHGLFRARRYARRNAPPIPLYAPPRVVDLVVELEDGDRAAVDAVFAARQIPGGPYQLGPFLLQSWPLPHYVPNAGVRLTAPGLTVAYTGDTGPCDALPDLGRNADLFIVDTTDWHQPSDAPPGPSLNLTAGQAGEAAAAAGVRRLLLTHFWPGNDRAHSAAVAATRFDGEVLLADEGLEIELG